MRILGIDPGFGRLGYAIVHAQPAQLAAIEYGVISTDSTLQMPERLAQIYDEVSQLVERFAPDSAASERQIFSANKTTALDVSKALGVVMLAAAHRNLQWMDYTPAEVKMAVTGNGSADKRQVLYMVTRLLNLKTQPGDDAADALAIAVCHANRCQLPL
jgi:crossover junction endodeoxyribonuclease RuvC